MMHRSSGGVMDGSYWFAIIYRRDQLTDIITLKLNMVRLFGFFLTLVLEVQRITALKVRG